MLNKDEEGRRARLREARVFRRYRSARAAAAELDLPESSYRSHENGNRPINEAAARLYADRFNISYDWLWEAKGEMEKGSGPNQKVTDVNPVPNAALPAIPITGSSAFLPIRGRAQGGEGGEIVLDGTVVQWLPGPSSLAEADGAYGLEVVGESMMNRYRPREIVWVDPRRSVHKGDNAVFQIRMPNGKLHAFIKEFVGYSNGNVVACQYNPEMELRWDRDDVEAIHLIVGTGTR